MRKVILQEFVSLDGMAADADGGVAFVPACTQGDRSFAAHQERLFDAIDTIVLGRVTYEMFAGYWPGVTDPEERLFADKMNTTPKLVFSRTLARAPWGTWAEAEISRTPPADHIANLKRATGGAMVIWGSVSIAQALRAAHLIDEYQLVVCPAVLRGGRPLFEGVRAAALTLTETRRFDRGAVLLKYLPERPA